MLTFSWHKPIKVTPRIVVACGTACGYVEHGVVNSWHNVKACVIVTRIGAASGALCTSGTQHGERYSEEQHLPLSTQEQTRKQTKGGEGKARTKCYKPFCTEDATGNYYKARKERDGK